MEETKQRLLSGGVGEIVEKKSRFIATIAIAESEEEALAFIAARKKEYWDARHNCYAYIIGNRGQMMRCSDDGEPAGTAGRPMLDVLLGANVCNVVAVVTRYFGGVLLGTGGLVRAYQGAMTAGLSACLFAPEEVGKRFFLTTDYNGYGRIDFFLREKEIAVENVDFGGDVVISGVARPGEVEALTAGVADATSGAAQLVWGDEVLFLCVDGKLIIF